MMSDRSGYYYSLNQTFRTIIRDEGILGLYKGLVPSLFVTIPTLALNYSIYGTCKSFATQMQIKEIYNKESNSFTPIGAIGSGAITGVITSLITFPIDLIRKRKQISSSRSHPIFKLGVMQQFSYILK
jgi:solute carrier family 25 phosphate transporter 23/24/25/41